jgi:FkbM family methyltransferase
VNYDPYWEPWLDELLSEIASTSVKPLLIDVGANVGQTISKFSNQIGDCRIISFEPNPECCAYLLTFLRYNPTLEVRLVSSALGEAPGLATLKTMGKYRAYDVRASTADTGRATWYERELCRVAQTSLDFVESQEPLDGLKLIKIDVEGTEFEIMKGAVGVINKYKPIMLFEVLPSYLMVENEKLPEDVVNERQRKADGIYSLLSGAGYTVWQNRGRKFEPVQCIDVRAITHFAQTAFIARHPEWGAPADTAARGARS